MTGEKERSSSREREALPFASIGHQEVDTPERRPHRASSIRAPTLSDVERTQLNSYLANIVPTRHCICEGMVMAMEFLANSKGVVDFICDTVLRSRDSKKIGAILFLINDILFNSVKVANAWTLKKDFEARLVDLMEDFNLKVSAGFEDADDLVKRTKKLLRIWQENNIFEQRLVTGW